MQSFIDLLSRTSRRCLQNKVPLIAGALVFGVVMALARGVYERQVSTNMERVLEGSESFNERIEELSRRAEMGDEEALREMVGEFGLGADLALGVLAEVLPAALVFLLFTFVVSTLAYTYFLVLATKQLQSSGALVGFTLGKFLPMLGLSIWTILRSFIWIPVIGFFLAIYFIPRLLFGGVIFVQEGKGVFESVSASYQRTKERWTPIFGYTVGIVVISWLASVIFAAVVSFTGPAKGFISGIFNGIVFGFAVVFVVLLADRVLGTSKTSPARTPLVPPAPTSPPRPAPPSPQSF